MTRSVFLALCLLIFNGFDVCSSQNTVTIYFNTSVLTVVEGRNIDIQLVAQGTFDQNFTVNLTFTDGTARYLMDYLYNPLITPSVTFTPGSMSSSVLWMHTIPNNAWEGPESFQVQFELPTDQHLNFNLESGRPDTLRVDIRDDDSVHISFQNSTQTVREDSGKLQLQLQSRGLYGRSFYVSFTCIPVFPTDAKDGDDFTGGLYTVQFQETSKYNTTSSSVEIPILNDLIPESTESFTCVILKPRDDGIIADCPNTIDIKIEDDDVIEVSFVKSVHSAEEGKEAHIRLNATPFEISFDTQIFVVILDSSRIETKYEAIIGVDYTAPRSLVGGVVHFDRSYGLLSTSLSIPLLSDNIAEGTEYFGLSFVPLTDEDNPIHITPVDPVQAIVAISDTNEILVRFNSSNFEIDEDASTLDVYYEVVREVSPGVYVPAEYTFDFQVLVTTATVVGSATENVDFDETVGSVTFSAGEQFSTPFSVKITDDTLCEGPEQFNISYSIISSSVRSGANVRQLDTTATVVINDNDVANIAFQESSQTVAESADVVELRLVADNVFEREQFIDLSAVDGTTNSGLDYVLLDERVRFPPNSNTSGPILVWIFDNMLLEPMETFTVMLRIPGPAATSGARGGAITEHTISIEDDDKIFIQFEQESYGVREGAGVFSIRLVLVNGTVLRPFDVSIVFMNGTAQENEDFLYGLTTTIASFGMRETESSSVTVHIIEDTLIEGNEDFTFRGVLDADTAARVEIIIPNPRVTIIDNDLLTVGLTEGEVTVTEGTDDVVNVTVQANIISDFPFHVFINLMDGTAESGTDFVGDRIRVDFAQFQTSVDVSIPLIDDNTAEEREWFTARLEVPPEFINRNITAGGIVRTRVIINDDDCVPVTMKTDKNTVIAGTIHFNTSTLTVVEGSNIDIQLVAQGKLCENFTVNVTFTDGTAKYLSDYFYNHLITPSVTFTPGSISSSVFRVITIPNNIWEDTKSFEVGFVLPPCPNLNSGRPDTLRVNIADDDSVHVSFQNSSITVREDSGSVQLQLQSNGQYGRRFSVSLTCIEFPPVEAKDGEDLTGGVYTVEFQTLCENSTVSSTAEIPIVNDSISECTESFICVILRPRGEGGIVVKDPNTITIVIEDNDLPLVSFVKLNITGGEGDVVQLRVNRTGSITRILKCKVRAESTTAEKGVDFLVVTKSVIFKKLNADSEMRTVRVKLLSGNTNCFRVVLECKPRVLIGCNKPSATVCIQGN